MVEYPFFFFSIIVGVCLIFITLRPFWETKDLWMNFVDSNPIEYVPIWLFEIKDLSFLNSMKFQRNGSMYIDFEEKISKSSNLSENFSLSLSLAFDSYGLYLFKQIVLFFSVFCICIPAKILYFSYFYVLLIACFKRDQIYWSSLGLSIVCMFTWGQAWSTVKSKLDNKWV